MLCLQKAGLRVTLRLLGMRAEEASQNLLPALHPASEALPRTSRQLTAWLAVLREASAATERAQAAHAEAARLQVWLPEALHHRMSERPKHALCMPQHTYRFFSSHTPTHASQRSVCRVCLAWAELLREQNLSHIQGVNQCLSADCAEHSYSSGSQRRMTGCAGYSGCCPKPLSGGRRRAARIGGCRAAHAGRPCPAEVRH